MLQEVHDVGAGVNPAPTVLPLQSRFTADSPLTIVGWLWRNQQSRVQYDVEHANIWAPMLDRHISLPHRFVLVTDHPRERWDEFHPLIEPVELWDDWRDLRNVSWGLDKPQCYVRLKAYSAWAREIFGDWFVSIDLDCVALQPLDPLFEHDDEFRIIHRAPVRRSDQDNKYQASMWMMKAGSRDFIWNDFKGEESIKESLQYLGSDQAWLRHRLGNDEAGWSEDDGVYGFPRIEKISQYRKAPPANARIIFFYGNKKPWDFSADNKVKPPRCQQCGAPVRLKNPFYIYRKDSHGGLVTSHGWVTKYWR